MSTNPRRIYKLMLRGARLVLCDSSTWSAQYRLISVNGTAEGVEETTALALTGVYWSWTLSVVTVRSEKYQIRREAFLFPSTRDLLERML